MSFKDASTIPPIDYLARTFIDKSANYHQIVTYAQHVGGVNPLAVILYDFFEARKSNRV